MSWLGGSISSLTGQLSNLTKDILTEGTEEISDPTTELRLAKEKNQQLDSLVSQQRSENERLKRINKELEENAESSELQINSISSQYRAALEEKEREVNTLKHQHQELLEEHARSAALTSTITNSARPSSSQGDWNSGGLSWATSAGGGEDFAAFNYDGDQGDWDFEDSISLQRDNNKLRSDVKRLQAQVKHWTSVAGQLGQNADQDGIQLTASADVLDLQHKIKDLEAEVSKAQEDVRHQAASLHDHHREKVSTLKSRHQTEVEGLRAQIAGLEQQLSDVQEGSVSSQQSGSGNLPEAERKDIADSSLQAKLNQALLDKEKAQNARQHLEGELEELQQEVARLQLEDGASSRETADVQAKINDLDRKLKESESKRLTLQTSLDEKTEITQALQAVKTEQEDVREEAENILEQLGDLGKQKITSDLLESLEKENLVLKEEKLKLEEQVTLLEKCAVTNAQDRQRLQTKVNNLKCRVQDLTGEETSSSDDTDTDVSSVSSIPRETNSALHIGQNEIDKELALLQAQLERQNQDLSGVEMERADWQMERESLEDVVTELRQKTQVQDQELQSLKSEKLSDSDDGSRVLSDKELNKQLATLEAEVSSIKTDKEELEGALEELDSQHSQALDQLIVQREQLASQLAQSNSELEQQKGTIMKLNETIDHLRLELADRDKSKGILEEKCTKLGNEMAALEKRDIPEYKQHLADISDLKEKIQKGGLVINDLHMDKQELEKELSKAREEISSKVTKLKEMREENVKLANEKKSAEDRLEASEDRLTEMEEELEKWQKVNEDRQVERQMEETKILKAQLKALEQEKATFTSDEISGSILDNEAKVRSQIESDGKLINDLRQEIQKLYDDKQKLKSDLKKEKEQRTTSIEEQEKLECDLESAIEKLSEEKAEVVEECQAEVQKSHELSSKILDAEKKLEEAGHQHEELTKEVGNLQKSNASLEESLQSQQKHFDDYVNDLKSGREQDAESLQAEHEKLLNIQREKNLEIDALKDRLKDQERLESELHEKTGTVEDLMQRVSTFTEHVISVKGEITRLEQACEEKDEKIEELKSKVIQFGTDLDEIEDGVSVVEEKHIFELSGKEDQLKALKDRNKGLQHSLSQTQEELSSSRSVSRQVSLQEPDDPHVNELKTSLTSLTETMSQLNVENSLKEESIKTLHEDLVSAQQTIESDKAGIAHLNEKAEGLRKELEKAETEVTRYKSQLAVIRQTSVDKETIVKDIQEKLSFLLTILTPQQVEKLQYFSENPLNYPALEYKEVKAIKYNDVEEAMVMSSDQKCYSANETYGCVIKEIDETDNTHDHSRLEAIERELEELRERLKEKDTIVSELQKSNSSLLGLLEGKGVKGFNTQVSTHKLEAELRSLRAEREQMMAVMSEKSRENSSLKSEVHRLMEVASASRAALEKLSSDNKELEQMQRSPNRGNEAEEDEMRQEALGNMARLVRDRETEIEALQQKNSTLLSVLQESSSESQAAAHLGPLLKEKEGLAEQLSALTSEREQLIACLTQKHNESVAYHGEMQRLASLVASVQDEGDKAKNDYNALIPSFEDKSRALVSTQTELIELKQKLKDLEVRHGELIQRSNSFESPNNLDLSDAQADLQRLKLVESDLRSSLNQREEKLQALTHKVMGLEEAVASKESECAHLKKQTESSKFQLASRVAELTDLKADKDVMMQKTSVQESECSSLRNSVNKLNLAMREKDIELSSMKEQVSTLTSLLQEQQGENTQVAQVMKENEQAAVMTRQLQQERDQQVMLADQRQHECSALRLEIQHLKDKEFKLTRELERLRGHLIQIEEGYTNEALDSEEREKELRNRLAVAEERLTSSSSQVEFASQESHRHVQSLEQQLHRVAEQRDSAYMQLATIQEQCQQYASSLGNLQLVLEHFQKEKDSAIASETERYGDEVKKLKNKIASMQSELEDTRGDLTEALDGLEAANRLSEQLDRKEEALSALKEEVQLRENALAVAEDEIHKLNSSTEARVDKTLMHNMVMTWLTSPENKRHEIVHLIGNIVGFSPDDFKKIDEVQGLGGLLSNIFRRQSASPPPPDPVKQKHNQSFSQLFVSFLETESSPPPSPMRLPAEAMAAETQQRHKQPTFNPFMAPRHVTHDGTRATSPSSSSSSSHLLMSHDGPVPTPLFAPLTSTSSSGESAILKDVLGKR